MHCPHCKTEIDEHEAGRCLDAWVADGVMDLTVHPSAFGSDWVTVRGVVPDYSTDIAAAWEVVGRRVWTFVDLDWDEEGWRSFFHFETDSGGIDEVFAIAPTAPLAICRAALKAGGE